MKKTKTVKNKVPVADRPVSCDKVTKRYLKSKVTTRDLMGM